MRKNIFLLLVFMSSIAIAEDYHWRVTTAYYQFPEIELGDIFPSAQSFMTASRAAAASYDSNLQVSCGLRSETSARCVVGNYGVVATRYGDSCPVGAEYDSSIGGCKSAEPDACESKAGTSFTFTKTGMAGDSYMSITPDRKWSAPAQDGCFDSCAVSTVDQRCKTLVSGAYACAGTAYYNGQQCTATTAPIDFTPDATPPEPTTTEKTQPCVYVTLPDGTQECESSREVEREGQQCGEVNGKARCVDRQPSKNGIAIITKVETEEHADGSKTVTVTDTATHQNCTGVNSCTSSTTTTTTTIKQDSNGNTTSKTGQCTGSACPDNNNPDNDGDGFGDCTGGSCGEGGGGPELDGDVPGFGDALSDFWDRLGQAPLIAAVDGISMNSGAGCDLPTSNETQIGSISMQPMCDNAHWLDPLYGIFLALHALAAVRVFMSA